jgi:hypothetical protein
MPEHGESNPSPEQMEEAYQVFKRRYERIRDLYGAEAMRSDLAAFTWVNEHHGSMVPMLIRLRRELLGETE